MIMKKDPLFILGIGRAGSHLLANALTLHPEIDIIEDVYISGTMTKEDSLKKLNFKNNTKK